MRPSDTQSDQCVLLKIPAVLWATAIIINATAAPAAADLIAQATSCNEQSVANPCMVDTESGKATPFGPLANAGVTDSISAPPVFGYLGQATGQAGFGHVGTSAELQVSSLGRLPEDGVGASGTATATDILRFSAGTTVRFGFTLHVPAVDVCGLTSGPSGPCDQTLARAASAFGGQIKPEYTFGKSATLVDFETDDNMGAVSTTITGNWNPRTGILLSDSISLIDPFTNMIVPGVDVLMNSTSFALAMGFDPHTPEQITRAAAIFGDTAILSQILVFDANGNPMPGVTITSASGTSYPLAATPAAVPEPAVFPLLALMLAVTAAVAWRRRKMARSYKMYRLKS